jgi:site-specific DNA-methyltransferase (adenine-specific)
MDNIALCNTDCIRAMKHMAENTIDAVVTDPPAGIAFMGKSWDDMGDLMGFQNFIHMAFTEVYRVLKPGGHCLVWALPRTSHHTAMGIERAGFEIRDVVNHIFATGFPKSMNIGKAIDKMQGNEREVIGIKDGQGNIPNDRGEWGLKPNTPIIVDKGNSDWEGWGTALKPAVEHWILCRKPISEKTIAENCLK